MNLLVILEQDQNNNSFQVERKRRENEEGSRTGTAGIINDFWKEGGNCQSIVRTYSVCPLSVRSMHASDNRTDPGGTAAASSAHPFQDALSIADPKSILNVDMNTGVEILEWEFYWGHNSYASPRTSRSSG